LALPDQRLLDHPAALAPATAQLTAAAARSSGGAQAERSRALHTNTAIGVLAELLAVAAVSAALQGSIQGRGPLFWLAFMAGTALLRLAVWTRFRSTGQQPAEALLCALWCAAGIGWGVVAVAFFPLENTLREGLILLVVCAIVALSLEVLHASRRALVAYAAPATLLPAVALLVTSEPMRMAFGSLLIVFLAVILFGLRRRQLAYEAQLASRTQNERLLTDLTAAERTLRHTVEEERLILETALVGIAIVKEHRFLRCNRRMEETFGARRGALTGASTRVLYADEAEWQVAIAAIDADLARFGIHDEEREFRRRDGRGVWCRYRGQIIDREDPSRGSIWVFEDLTEQKRAAEEMLPSEAQVAQAALEARSAHARLTDAIACVPDAFALFDREDRLVLCNERYLAEYPGRPCLAKLLGKTYEDLLVDAIQAGDPIPVEFKKNLPGWVAELMTRHRNPGDGGFIYQAGEGRWWQIRERRTSDGGTVVVKSDITELKRTEERVRHLAHHDPLTGLPNRRLLDDRMQQAFNLARRSRLNVGVMLIDLDRFKVVNDTYGHEMGDRVLQEVARRLRATVRQVDTVARQGGDEFVVVLPELHRSSDAARVANKVLQQLAKPIILDDVPFQIGASIGISMFPPDGGDPETLLKQADAAMYRAKSSGSGGFEFVVATPTQQELELV
jgi:diguanylate cyclase (GGDEF)-like protein/PAS domain S-box-containing protein